MTEKDEKPPVQLPGSQRDHRTSLRQSGSIPLPLPGLAAIALYLVVLAGVIILGVVTGGHYPAVFLVFSALFMAASGGLLLSFRWAWALALAAVVLLTAYNLWVYSSSHQPAGLVQGLLNLVFFLYLIRPEVRQKLR